MFVFALLGIIGYDANLFFLIKLLKYFERIEYSTIEPELCNRYSITIENACKI